MSAKFFEKLSSNLNQLLKDSDEYNVIIEVGQAPNIHAFKAHSIILNSRCLYFKDKLIVFELLIASNEFGLEELIKHIQLFLLENNASWLRLNFSRVYQTSLKDDNLKNLQQFCANIIAKHQLDNLQMDEGKIWDYIINWGIAQNPSLPLNPDQWSDEHFLALKSSLQNCLPLIRYFQISGEDIFEKVRPYQKILDQTLWADIMLKFMAPNKAISTSNVLTPRKNLTTTLPFRDIADKGITEIESNRASELRKSGKAYRIMGKYEEYEESLADLNKSLEIEPDNTFASKCRGATYYWMDRYEESLADLSKALEIKPNDAFALRSRGDTYRVMRRYEESLANLNKSLEIEPDNVFALKCRGETYYVLDRYVESLADLNKSLEIEPDNAFVLRVRGKTYYMMYRYEESLADFNKSLDRYEESLADFNKSLVIEPNDAFALRSRGDTYRMMGKYEESLADLNQSLEIEPNDVFALNIRGYIYYFMGMYKESLADLNKSLEINPNSEDALDAVA
ncbi:hypothetical protein C2G38_2190506 [Gigaspora rosea]|uniref:Uncharacterized protein n=1 Tax=Gigaspora rosea TaxID=44941 RepID=A0A397VAC7_9GLOM|nr:hypothetical protein C2G38_2190506 [Gigaspora rosea]